MHHSFRIITRFLPFLFSFCLLLGCNNSPNGADNGDPNGKSSNYSGPRPKTGCITDKNRYQQIDTYEQLDATIKSNGLPAAVSLLQYAPRRQSQGQLGACSAWANAYAARTISAAIATGQNPNDIIYSPAFLYNQLSPDCQEGIFLGDALQFMKSKGAVYLHEYPYNGENCSLKAEQSDYQSAKEHRISGYTRLSSSGAYFDVDLDAIKQHIARNCPVIIAQNVPESFFQAWGKERWQPTAAEQQNAKDFEKAPPHAMCIIGYDDNRYGGAFHVMNSWGMEWGKDGCIWVTYEDMGNFCGEAYVMHPDKRSKQVSADEFQIAFGLQRFEDGNLTDFIELQPEGSKGNSFINTSPLTEGDRFKILVENSKDCYLYIFGIDGSDSYVLFPYEKTSAYFGVTGTRTFPKKKSFTVEGSNDFDYMCIVASKTELDPEAISDRISNSNAPYYSGRVAAALKKDAVPNQQWQYSQGAIMYDGDRKGKNVIYAVFNLQKQ